MLVVYNTLARGKETFKPMREGEVGMYVCGPTVYDSCHLGHARSVVAFDVIRRYLEYKRLRVRYIQNFTDIDDKMIKRAQERGVTAAQLAAKYIREYFEDFDLLGVKRATVSPRATEYIPDMVEAIQKLVKKGFAYEAKGSVYFRVGKSKDYGKLSGQKAEELHDTAEAEQAGEKESPQDFVLWKAMKPNFFSSSTMISTSRSQYSASSSGLCAQVSTMACTGLFLPGLPVGKPTSTRVTLPIRPLRTSSQARRNSRMDRCWLPHWTMQPYFVGDFGLRLFVYFFAIWMNSS